MRPVKTTVEVFDSNNHEDMAKLHFHVMASANSVQDIHKIGNFIIVVTGGVSMGRFSELDEINIIKYIILLKAYL
jgi:hypothetical protein